MGDIDLSVSGLQDLERLSKRLKDARRGDLQKQLRKNIGQAARPVEGQLRAAALGVRVTSSRGGIGRPDQATGLRQRVASAVDTRHTRRGVRFVVDANRVDAKYGASLPRYLDGELQRYRRWRHPVFGNTENWQAQTGRPWFFVTVRRHRDKFEKAVLDAMDETLRKLAG